MSGDMSARERRLLKDAHQKKIPRRKKQVKRRPVLVVCEGRETEFNYLNGMKKSKKARVCRTVHLRRGKGGTRLKIVERAVEVRDRHRLVDDFVKTWCVMDVETNSTSEEMADLRDARKLAKEEGIDLCLSNPCFEVWIRSHFKRSSQPFLDCGAVVRDVTTEWKGKFGREYKKNDGDVFHKLDGRGLTEKAIEHARDVREKDHIDEASHVVTDIAEANSSTDVYKLVEYLLGKTNASPQTS
jgi:RloB-like protein